MRLYLDMAIGRSCNSFRKIQKYIILLFLIPIVVNQLMSFNIAKVYGDTNSWIGFLGVILVQLYRG